MALFLVVELFYITDSPKPFIRKLSFKVTVYPCLQQKLIIKYMGYPLIKFVGAKG